MNRQEDPSVWFGSVVPSNARMSFSAVLSESYSGMDVSIPVHVWRGRDEGPVVCVTAAVHGDEINGVGAIRSMLRDKPFELVAGTLVLVPVVNMLGFERHTRYLPDRRDLNRSFPGTGQGSLASRIAHSFFTQITSRCDYGIDLHTAAVRRTNFPNVRADMSDPRVAEFARAFGAELIVSGRGPVGSLRNAATEAGCATIILEAGEVWKVEPAVIEYAIRGVSNCLRHLGMIQGEPEEPPFRVETDSTRWVRAERGGFLEFHVGPGEIVDQGDPIATNTDLEGQEINGLIAPHDGIVLGMTTIPSVAPGDPICHLAFPRNKAMRSMKRAVKQLDDTSLHERMRENLASSMLVTDPESGV